jgi:WS/DGAT/MGAT family acyltransferase
MSAGLPRLRQRVVGAPLNLATPEWVDDEHFDVDYHVRRVAVPAPGGMAELLAELGPLYASPLDRDRPLWEAYVAEGLIDGRGAVFVKVHHCLTDGVAGARLMQGLMGERREGTPPVPAARGPARSTIAVARLERAVVAAAGEAFGVGGAAAGALAGALLHPTRTLRALAGGAGALAGFAREVAVPRAESPLHRERSLSRRLAIFDMHLAEIDAVRARVGATNNDVVLAVLSGALHRWHTAHGADVKELRALVPVSIRGAGDAAAGNRIALVAMSLPVGEPNPLERLRRIQEGMGRIKTDRRATVYPLLARALTFLPLPLAAEIGRQQTERTNLVCTNVPGPRHACYLAGEAIERLYPYAPLVGDHPVAVALFSYRDMVHVGLDVDPLAMDDLPRFLDALAESYREVVNVGTRAELRRPA